MNLKHFKQGFFYIQAPFFPVLLIKVQFGLLKVSDSNISIIGQSAKVTYRTNTKHMCERTIWAIRELAVIVPPGSDAANINNLVILVTWTKYPTKIKKQM